MSAIAIDLDGTLTHDRGGGLIKLMELLCAAGCHVVVLSACQDGLPTRSEKLELLSNLGLRENHHFTEVVIVEGKDGLTRGRMKGAFCAEHKIDTVIDDDPEYLAIIRTVSAMTTCLQFKV